MQKSTLTLGQKISLALQGNTNGRGNKGRGHSEEHKRKNRLAHIGKPVSKETRLKLSTYWKGRERPNRRGVSHQPRKVGEVSTLRKTHLGREKLAGRAKPDLCELCGGGGRIVFDHNHSTGEFRGWLCQNCNVTLGFVKESPKRLQILIGYIENNGVTLRD